MNTHDSAAVKKRSAHYLMKEAMERYLQTEEAQQAVLSSVDESVAHFEATGFTSRSMRSDEPFGALDAKVRKELRRWLRRLHDELHVTMHFCYPRPRGSPGSGRPRGVDEHWPDRANWLTPRGVGPPGQPVCIRLFGDVNLFHGRAHQGEMLIGEDQLGVRLATRVFVADG